MRLLLSLGMRALATLLVLVSMARADQVFLTNGDRVTGALVVLENDRLEIRTAYDDTLTIPRKDVVAVVVDGEVTVLYINGVLTTGRLRTDRAGRMQLNGGQVDPRFWFGLQAIAALHPGQQQAQPSVRWSGRVDLALEAQSGNSDTDSLEIDGKLTGEWQSHRLVVTADADFERADGDSSVQEAQGTFRHDRFVSKKLFFFTTIFLEHDKFKDLNLRGLSATGPAISSSGARTGTFPSTAGRGCCTRTSRTMPTTAPIPPSTGSTITTGLCTGGSSRSSTTTSTFSTSPTLRRRNSRFAGAYAFRSAGASPRRPSSSWTIKPTRNRTPRRPTEPSN